MISATANNGVPPYKAAALYLSEADLVEYIRRDEPAVHRRIDHLLTLILSLEDREPIGFQLKGFRHFYSKYIRNSIPQEPEFLELVAVLETALDVIGERIFETFEVKHGYEQAKTIATSDQVSLYDVPKVA